VCRETGVVR